jgi:bifunctional non-homologous end joining protein LigD
MTTATITDSTTLYYRQGSSDKEYHASVEPEGGGYVVRFRFGRRGSTLQTGVKTLTPVDYQTARRFYEKLVREKLAKGYTPGEAGTPYQDAGQQDRVTGILPQLLNPISEDQAARLIDDPDWWAQGKFDGKRILIRKANRGSPASTERGYRRERRPPGAVVPEDGHCPPICPRSWPREARQARAGAPIAC